MDLKLFFLLAYAFNAGNCLIINELGVDSPTLLLRSQWSYYDRLSFGKNYSVRAAPSCVVNPSWNGSIVWINGFTITCTTSDAVNYLVSSGAAGVYFGFFAADFWTMTNQASIPLGNTIPCFSSRGGGQTPISLPYPGFQTEWSLVIGGLLAAGKNLTILLTPPVMNQFYVELQTINSSVQWVYFLSVLSSLIVLCMSCVKFFDMIIAGGLRFSLPILVTSFSFAGGVMSLFLSMIGLYSFHGEVNQDIWFCFAFWPLCFSLCVCIMLGLYFSEVSRITSGQINGFGKLNIVAILLLGGLWVVEIILGVIQAADPPGLTGVSSNTLIAMISFISAVVFFGLIICLWGGISLLKNLGSAGHNKWNAIFVVLSMLIGLFLAGGTGLYAVVGLTYTSQVAPGASPVLFVSRLDLFLTCTQMLALILILLNFRANVQKEIELSKSGTSSTSSLSSSSKKSSSSSSSSSSDPVIEL